MLFLFSKLKVATFDYKKWGPERLIFFSYVYQNFTLNHPVTHPFDYANTKSKY